MSRVTSPFDPLIAGTLLAIARLIGVIEPQATPRTVTLLGTWTYKISTSDCYSTPMLR